MEREMSAMNYFDSRRGGGESVESTSSGSSAEESDVEEPPTKQASVESKGEQAKPMLSALDAFDKVGGPPEFLDPEAIRPAFVMKARKRKSNTSTADTEAEKKPRQTVITAKPITYETPRDPELAPTPSKVQEGAQQGSKAMPVDDFLNKGGGAMLPRKTRLQRDKEKAKREKGQSSHSTWKSEDEMLLRQQFD